MTIDITRLRRDLREECMGAFFGGGFGGAALEAEDVDRMPSDRVVAMAQRYGLRLEDYAVPEYGFDDDFDE